MFNLSDFLFYRYNDSIISFVLNFGNKNNTDYLINVTSGRSYIDFLTNTVVNFLTTFIHPLAVNNIMVLIFLGLSIFSSYIFFKNLNLSKVVSWIFSFFFAFSLYFQYRVFSMTIPLYAIFIFPLLFLFLYKNIKPYLLGLYVLIALLVSNYYGFFCVVIVGFWYGFSLLLSKDFSKKNIINFFKSLGLFVLPVMLGVLILFANVVFSNLTLSRSYARSNTNSTQVYRPIEDYFNLSFRPWYFFTPPKNSVVFGDLSKSVYTSLENTNYYLATNYMEDEMAGSFLGWQYIAGLLFILFVLFIAKNKSVYFKNLSLQKPLIYKLLLIFVAILVFTGPPYFTVSGIKFYTPSYLLYYVVPMFRVLVRWGIVLYFIVLVLNALVFQAVLNSISYKHIKRGLIFLVVLAHVVMFLVKVPLINISNLPKEIAFLHNTPENTSYYVYPKGDYYSIFWIFSHKRHLINPMGVLNPLVLSTEDSLNETNLEILKSYDVDYLILYPNILTKEELSYTYSVLDNSVILEKVLDVENCLLSKSTLLYELNNVGDHSSVEIYKIN